MSKESSITSKISPNIVANSLASYNPSTWPVILSSMEHEQDQTVSSLDNKLFSLLTDLQSEKRPNDRKKKEIGISKVSSEEISIEAISVRKDHLVGFFLFQNSV